MRCSIADQKPQKVRSARFEYINYEILRAAEKASTILLLQPVSFFALLKNDKKLRRISHSTLS